MFFSGCAHFSQPHEERIPELSELPVEGSLEISTQYAYSTGPKVGGNTVEIYLQNKAKTPLAIKSIRLNDVELPVPTPAIEALKSTSLSVDGMQMPLDAPMLPENDVAAWWQLYPREEAGPGETIVMQICFREPPTFQRNLKLETTTGEILEMPVPRFRTADQERLITAVTFTTDYRRMFVQYKSPVPLKRLWICNREVKDFAVLLSPEPGTPSMAAFRAPFRIRNGMPLHVRAQFEGGHERHALLRALSGIQMDTPPDASPSGRQAKKLGLDHDADVIMIPYDVTCDDVDKGKGYSARAVVPERLRDYREHPDRLAGIGYCTAIYDSLWNIYGPISDAVYAKPYRLGISRTARRFIEEEEDCIEKAGVTAAPRPFFWIPQRFGSEEGRFLELEEMKLLAWTSLIRGGKGIRYNFWRNPEKDPFKGCPLIPGGIADLNREIRLGAEALSPLAFVSEKTLGNDKEGRIKVYTAWAGDRGILVMVRNMDYQTDDKGNDEGRSPRFRAKSKTDVTVPVLLPDWFKFGGAKGFLTGLEVPFVKANQKVDVKLQSLDSFQLVWLENK